MTDDDRTLRIALLVMRLTLALLFAVWVADKLLSPDHAKQVLAVFYGQDAQALPSWLPYALGAAQAAVVAAFALGAVKTVSYGLVLLMHLSTTIVSAKMHLDPLAVPNILFWANWPILGALVALFLLRRRDTLASVG